MIKVKHGHKDGPSSNMAGVLRRFYEKQVRDYKRKEIRAQTHTHTKGDHVKTHRGVSQPPTTMRGSEKTDPAQLKLSLQNHEINF